MTLSEFVNVKSFVCKISHNTFNKKCSCDGLIKVAKFIDRNGYMKLKEAFEISSPGKSYTSSHARQKLLQMPLAAIGIGSPPKGTFCFLVVEKQPTVNYHLLQTLLEKTLESHQVETLSKNEVSKLLFLAESESEKERLRYAITKASSLSSTKAREIYGFHDMDKRMQKVEEAVKEAQSIKECIEKICKLKDKALLHSFGVDDEKSSSDSESESDFDEADMEKSFSEHGSPFSTVETSGEDTVLSPIQFLEILRKCSLNWFEFVKEIQDMFKTTAANRIQELLLDFKGKLSSIDITPEDKKIIDQSYKAYIQSESLQRKQQDVMEGMIVSESESSEEEHLWSPGEDLLGQSGRALLKKKRAAMKRKAVREIKKKVAERRFLKRRRSKRVSKVLKDCPGIGKTIEEFVKNCGVGADAWRRTGILTFDGNRKLEKKATFKRIKEHLEEVYKRTFAYGTVVQLCVARNKRRLSAKRYRGVANVTQRRARKGFNTKYNPDCHWSNAFYAALDIMQYKDGRDITNVGRDDQAGFRLDTMTTHKLHPTLCVRGNEHLTTYTDYTTKYPSKLQTTSYNFSSTETTGEICCGVVKAPLLHTKNAAQHFVDLQFLQEEEAIKPAFINPETKELKKIECIRVDGGCDEGPSHTEVQYWWTRRHLEARTTATLVTSRNSGASFRNRVELQNGCLALGHANLFIPSTLNGSCLTQSGVVNEDILRKNLDSAIDAYISRVDGSPCASTEIHLFKGRSSDEKQKENELLKIFLKGRKSDKLKLANENPVMFLKFEETWALRERHMMKNVPTKYIFFLRCCYKEDCIHPDCQAGRPEEEVTWYPGGPPIDFLPLPLADPERPYNGICKVCTKQPCLGHYMKYEKLLDQYLDKRKMEYLQPPSVHILDAYQKNKSIPQDHIIEEIAQATLLPVEEVNMWFTHVREVSENRSAGAKKAAKKRKEKIANQVATENEDDVCEACGECDPPGDDAVVSWISCDGCLLWWHKTCVGLLENYDSEQWLCLSCREIW